MGKCVKLLPRAEMGKFSLPSLPSARCLPQPSLQLLVPLPILRRHATSNRIWVGHPSGNKQAPPTIEPGSLREDLVKQREQCTLLCGEPSRQPPTVRSSLTPHFPPPLPTTTNPN